MATVLHSDCLFVVPYVSLAEEKARDFRIINGDPCVYFYPMRHTHVRKIESFSLREG